MGSGKKEGKTEERIFWASSRITLFGSCLIFFFFFFGDTHDMEKFPGEKSNLCHSSDNAESLTTRPPGNSWSVLLLNNCVPFGKALI